MTKIVLFIFLSLIFVYPAFGEFYVLYNKSSKEIINIADKESDFQIAESDKAKLEIQAMSGSFGDVELESAVQDYKMSNGKFVLNTKKVSGRENAKSDNEQKESERKVALESARTKLIALGLTSDECSAFLK